MPDVPESLAALEERLAGLSHETEALDLIQAFAQSLGKTKARQQIFNTPGALVRTPILYQDVLQRQLISAEDDAVHPHRNRSILKS
jgi:hypothetical protein